MIRSVNVAGAIAGALLLYASPAAAQATRTWVSGSGDDVNPCSYSAPCRTFAGAISKTAAGGEINCLDSGAYGTVTIIKSIALVCEGVTAGVLHSSTTGIIVNAAATDNIYIKGLDINGSPPSSAGLNGIRFLAGGSLTVENSVIRGSTGAAPNGYGIMFQPNSAARLAVRNVTIQGNGVGNTGGGILVQPSGTGSAKVTIDDSQIVNNAAQAIRIDTTGNTGAGNMVTITRSTISQNGFGLLIVTPASTTSAIVTVVGSTIAQNSGTGILANGTTAQVRVSGTTITGNGAGGAGQGGLFVGSGANIVSYGDNLLYGNAPDGTFTASIGKN